MKRWLTVILALVLLLQAFPITALAVAVSGKPITEAELAAAYELAGLNDGASEYHSGMPVSASMNAWQLSGWLDEQLKGGIASVGQMLAQAQSTLAQLRESDPEAYALLGESEEGQAMLARCRELQLEAEDQRQTERFLQERLEESIAMVDQMGSLLRSDTNYDHEVIRYSERVRQATDQIRAIRKQVLQSSSTWSAQVAVLQSAIEEKGSSGDAQDGALGDWICRVFAAQNAPETTQVVLHTRGANSLSSRLKSNGSVLPNGAVGSTSITVSSKDEIWFELMDDDKKPVKDVKIRARDAGSSKDFREGTTDAEGKVRFFVIDFTQDDDGYMKVDIEADAQNTGNRDFCIPNVNIKGGDIYKICPKKDDGKPYLYKATFDGKDMLYQQYNIIYSKANEVSFDIVVETRNQKTAPMLCLRDGTGQEKIIKATKTDGNTYTFTDKWKKQLNPDAIKEIYFRWGVSGEQAEIHLTPIRSVFDQPTDLSSLSEGLTEGLGISFKLPKSNLVQGSEDVEVNVSFLKVPIPISISVDVMGSVAFLIGISEPKHSKLQHSWEKADTDYWNMLTKGLEEDSAHFLGNLGALSKEMKSLKVPAMREKTFTLGVFAMLWGSWQEEEGTPAVSLGGSLGGSVSFSYDFTQQGMLGPVPAYFTFGFTTSVSAAFTLIKLNIAYDSKTHKRTSTDVQWCSDVTISIPIGVSLTLGAGIKGLLCLWAKGAFSFNFLFTFSTKEITVKVGAEASLTVGLTAAFYFEISAVLLKGSWTLYPNNDGANLLLDHYMSNASDAQEERGRSKEPDTYPPQLIPERTSLLDGLEAAQDELRILALGGDIYAFLIRDGRVHWYNITNGKSGDTVAYMDECLMRYPDSIDIRAYKDYDFDVCVASGTREYGNTYQPWIENGLLKKPDDYFVVAGMYADELGEDGLPTEGAQAGIYVIYLWRNAESGELIWGYNGDVPERDLVDRDLSFFQTVPMTGEPSAPNRMGHSPQIFGASYYTYDYRDESIASILNYFRECRQSVFVEYEQVNRSGSGNTQQMSRLKMTLNTRYGEYYSNVDKRVIPVYKIGNNSNYQILNDDYNLTDDDVHSGAGEDYSRVQTQCFTDNTMAHNTLVAVSRSEGGAGDKGVIELYDDVMDASKGAAVLAQGDIDAFEYVPSPDGNGCILFYTDDVDTSTGESDEIDNNHFLLKGLKISPMQYGNNGDMAFSTTQTTYDISLPARHFKIYHGDLDLLYWLTTASKGNDGKDLYRIMFATYDPNSNMMADEAVFAEFSMPDENMAIRELYLTEDGTWYYTAAEIPEEKTRDKPKPLTLYRFPTKLMPVLDIQNQVVTDLLVRPGDYDDVTVTLMNSGNLAATQFDLDLVLIENDKESVVQTLHADLVHPENGNLTMDGEVLTTGEKAMFRLEDYEFTPRQRDFVVSETQTNYTVEGGTLKPPEKGDAHADYLKSKVMMPGSAANFRGTIKIPDDWKNTKNIELRVKSVSSSLNWLGAVAAANNRNSLVASPDASEAVTGSTVTWVRDAQTGDMVLEGQSTQEHSSVLLGKTGKSPKSIVVTGLHDLDVHGRVYAGPGGERMLTLAVSDDAQTGESIHLTAAVYVDDAREPFYVDLPYYPERVSDHVTHTYDMPLATLVDPYAHQKARVVILGTDIEESALSNNEFTLYLDGKPDALIFLRQPRDVTIQEGESASFSVQVTGGVWPYAYQWQVCDPKHKKWVDLEGFTESTISREKVEKKWDGTLFRCVVTDRAGTSITSDAAKLTVRSSMDTGDDSNLPLYLAVALIALVLLWLLRRKVRNCFERN